MSRAVLVAAIYIAGAAAYFTAIEALDVTFGATPLIWGLVVLVASVFQRDSLPTAIALLAWGTGVLLIRHGPLPDDREAPAFVVAFGVGALALLLGSGFIAPLTSLRALAVTMLTGGLGFYLAYDFEELLEAWPWAVLMAANGIAALLQLAMSNRRSTTG